MRLGIIIKLIIELGYNILFYCNFLVINNVKVNEWKNKLLY
jgi:hypothetical protein